MENCVNQVTLIKKHFVVPSSGYREGSSDEISDCGKINNFLFLAKKLCHLNYSKYRAQMHIDCDGAR